MHRFRTGDICTDWIWGHMHRLNMGTYAQADQLLPFFDQMGELMTIFMIGKPTYESGECFEIKIIKLV